MLSTWSENAQERPDFPICQSIINKTLDDALEKVIVVYRIIESNHIQFRIMEGMNRSHQDIDHRV